MQVAVEWVLLVFEGYIAFTLRSKLFIRYHLPHPSIRTLYSRY